MIRNTIHKTFNLRRRVSLAKPEPVSYAFSTLLEYSLDPKELSSKSQLPKEADVVIIGGGSVGASTLYHLAKKGVSAILLEKDDLTSGTTWHSAGLLWRCRPSDVDTQLIAHTRDLAMSLEAETGESSGWNQNGGLFVCGNKPRLHEFQRLSKLGSAFGIESHMLTPAETKQLHPLVNVDDMYGAMYSPGDGTIDPTNWVMALAKGAKMNGAKIFTKSPVAEIQTVIENGSKRIDGVVTKDGHVIKTRKVVNCGGVWAPNISALVGVGTPLCAMKHAYVVTGHIDGIAGTPNLRDHDESIYFKVQGNSLQVGGYEQNPLFWDKVDNDFHFGLFDLDWDIFEAHIHGAIHRMPIIKESEIPNTVCGPESFTPDHKPLMGEVPGCRGFYVGAGFNSAGIMLAGGCGQQLAEWVVEGQPTLDMFGFDIKRYHPNFYESTKWIKETSHESYAKNYSIVFPCDEPMAGRNVRKDPLHEQMVEANCVFQSRHHWERPGWFVTGSDVKRPEVKAYDYYGHYGYEKNENYGYGNIIKAENSFNWPSSHVFIADEVISCREYCAVFNQSYFGKFFLEGPDAQKAMDFICTANMDKPDATTTYTLMCNSSGGIMCDLTVTKLRENSFYITSGGGTATHDYHWISKIVQDQGFDCEMRNETDDHGMLSIQGPNSRALVRDLVLPEERELLELENFPFSTCKSLNIEIDGVKHPVRILRLTFVGELGFELHIPKDSCVAVYKKVMEQGKKYHIVNGGYRAIDSMSIEKGYKHWHEDIRMDDTPLEAGLGWTCKLKTDTNFLGRAALEKQKEEGIKKKLICLTLDDHIPLHRNEPILANGEIVGYVRRGDFGHTCGKVIAYGYVSRPDGAKMTNKWLKEQVWTVNTTNRDNVNATFQAKNVYDPNNLRVKGEYAAYSANMLKGVTFTNAPAIQQGAGGAQVSESVKMDKEPGYP